MPYKVRCKCVNGLGGGKTDKGVLKYIGNCNGVISNYYEDIPIDSGFVNNVFYPIENIKPYLRPMSSMTEKEVNELKMICDEYDLRDECGDIVSTIYGMTVLCGEVEDIYPYNLKIKISPKLTYNVLDYLNAHHFDYRGLIPMGLALEAPEGMYDIKHTKSEQEQIEELAKLKKKLSK